MVKVLEVCLLLMSTVAIVTALGSLLALVIEKIRMSRCTHIRCCCCELERDVIDSDAHTRPVPDSITKSDYDYDYGGF